MTERLLKTIYWQEVYSRATYLYGSLLDISKEEMHFYNPRLAPGKPIVRFTSRTNYQGDRRSPDLPLLIPNSTYRLECQIVSEPENRIYIQIDYFNRQNEQISFDILREGVEEFSCPQETFVYTITVLSAGCQRVRFKELRLYQKEATSDENLKRQPLQKRYVESQLPEELQFVKPFIQLI